MNDILNNDDEPPLHSTGHYSVFIISDLNRCRKLWKKFSLSKDLESLWDYRYSFHKGLNATAYFITLFDQINKKIVGFIPLEYLPSQNKYYSFGGGIWSEHSPIYLGIKIDDSLLELLLERIPNNSDIRYLSSNINNNSKLLTLDEESTYYLTIPESSKTLDIISSKFGHDHRRKFISAMKKISNLQIEVLINDKNVIDDITCLNISLYKDESTYKRINFYQVLKNIKKNRLLGKFIHSTSLKINGKVEAASFCILYNGIFFAMSEGYNRSFNNLGNYLHYVYINEANKLKASKVNFYACDCGWKDHWHLEKERLLKFIQPRQLEMQFEKATIFSKKFLLNS